MSQFDDIVCFCTVFLALTSMGIAPDTDIDRYSIEDCPPHRKYVVTFTLRDDSDFSVELFQERLRAVGSAQEIHPLFYDLEVYVADLQNFSIYYLVVSL